MNLSFGAELLLLFFSLALLPLLFTAVNSAVAPLRKKYFSSFQPSDSKPLLVLEQELKPKMVCIEAIKLQCIINFIISHWDLGVSIIENILSCLIHFYSLFLCFLNSSVIIVTVILVYQHSIFQEKIFLGCIFQLFYICIKISLCVSLTYMFSLFLDLFLENLSLRVKPII